MSPWYQVLTWVIIAGFAGLAVVCALTGALFANRKTPSRVKWSQTKVSEVFPDRKDLRKFLVENVPDGASAYQVCYEPGIPPLTQEYQPDEDGTRYVVERILASRSCDVHTWMVVVKYVPLAEAA